MMKEQLNLEKFKDKITDLKAFSEGMILFPPSFKFIANSSEYQLKDLAWADRILFRDKKKYLKQISYDSNREVIESDHRPVFSQFLLLLDANVGNIIGIFL